jgi:hypothetical protein
MKAGQANNALLQYEAGQELVAMHKMTTTDSKTFAASDSPWSNAAGFEPKIYPDGLATGGIITPTSATNDSVDIASATAYQAGELITVTGDTLASADGLTRPGAGEYVIHSIIIDDTGVYDVQAGTATTDQSGFSNTRGAAGGPPLIPVGAIEVGQVRMSGTAAQVVAADIKQVDGVSSERYDVPSFTEDFTEGTVQFISTLPAIHTGSVCKSVYAEVYTPVFADLEPTADFVPPETTHSISSTEVYGGAIGASSSSLGQGSFTAYLKDGLTDPIVKLKNKELWFRFYPDRLKSPYMLVQGIFGISRTFPAGSSLQASCTITASAPGVEVLE